MSTQRVLPLRTERCGPTRRLVVDPFRSYSHCKLNTKGRISNGFMWSNSSPSSSTPSLTYRPSHSRVRPTAGTLTDCNGTSAVCVHESTFVDDRKAAVSLRHPPVNPRKTRRYCTDFGLNDSRTRTPPLPGRVPRPLKPDHSSVISLFSTLFADFEGTESDSSLSEDTDYDFPKPPLIAPAVRRVQSSPLFTLKEAASVREFPNRHCSQDFQEERVPRPSLGLDAQHAHQTCNPPAPGSHVAIFLAQSQSEGAVRRQPTNEPLLAPSNTQQIYRAASEDVPPQQIGESSTPSKCSCIIRKVASVRQSLKQSDAPPTLQPFMRTKSIKFEHKAEIFPGRPQQSVDELEHDVPRQRRWSITRNQNYQPVEMYDSPASSNATCYIPPAQDRRQRLSTPLIFQTFLPSELDHASGNHLVGPRGHSSFLQHSTRGQPAIRVPASQDRMKMPKSFMDITPERKSKGESVRKERVRKLLSRASSGILGWGKAMTGKH